MPEWKFKLWLPLAGRIVEKGAIAKTYDEAEEIAKSSCGSVAIVISYM